MNKWSKRWIGIGTLFLLAAFCLICYNLWCDAQAGAAADSILQQMTHLQSFPEQDSPVTELPSAQSPFAANPSEEIPDYILNPEMEMPTQEIDGQECIGTLGIETLGISLPVLSDWSYPKLRISPCRYSGSVYQHNMVIAGHNYSNHFGSLKNLVQGDAVTFTDMDGNVFCYQVAEIETLPPYATQEMTSGEWDLTLFTCTVGGQSRIAVRCEITDNSTP